DADATHRALELRTGRQRMPTSALFPGHVFKVDELRARDVSAAVLIPAAAPGEVPAEVDHANVPLIDVLAEPGSVDERTERQLDSYHPRVVAEVNGVRVHRMDLGQRSLPRDTIGVLAGPVAEVRLLHLAIDLRRVRRVA